MSEFNDTYDRANGIAIATSCYAIQDWVPTV